MHMAETMLELDNINTFYGKAHILHDLSFQVAAGEVVALLGRNGAGKTTTMRTIMQLARAQSGAVRFEGADITPVQTSYQAPDMNAIAERFVGSIKRECLDRVILLGEALIVGGAAAAVYTDYTSDAAVDDVPPPLPETSPDEVERLKNEMERLVVRMLTPD